MVNFCFFKKDIMGIVLGIISIIGAIICYSVCAVPKSEYEQRLEDEAQMVYIKEWNEKHRKI
jgi:hypothetical protein